MVTVDNSSVTKKFPYLQQFRIIRPIYASVETASSDITDLFLGLDNTRPLEILDLSGSNRGMGRNLPASISKATLSCLYLMVVMGWRMLCFLTTPR